ALGADWTGSTRIASLTLHTHWSSRTNIAPDTCYSLRSRQSLRPGGPASPLAPADPAGPCAPAIALRSSGTGVIPGDQTLALLTNTGLQRIEQRHYVLALHSDGG